MTTRRLLIQLVTISLVLAIAGCSKEQTSGPKGNSETTATLHVGALLPQTGPGAVFADYVKKGLDLAAEEANGRQAGAIEMIYADSKNEPAVGVSAFQQMVLTRRPPVVITALSSVTRAVAPMAKPNNTVVIGTAVGLPDVTQPSEYVFRVYPEAHGLAGVIARYASGKYKTAAVAYVNDDFGASGADVFRKTFESLGGGVLLTEPYNLAEKDFRAQWEKIKAAGPECVWITGYGPAYSVLVRQFKEVGCRAVLLGDMTLGLPVTLKNVGDAAEGVVYVDGLMEPDFIQRYKRKYGEAPTSYAGYAYDILRMLDTVRQKDGISPDKIRAGFAAINAFPGAMGSITILPSRDASLRFVLMQIRAGQPFRLQE